MKRPAKSTEANSHAGNARRPLFLTTEALAIELGMKSANAARRHVRREGIPYFYVGRRMFVRDDALIEWAIAREIVPAHKHPPIQPPPPWKEALLERRPAPSKRRGGKR